MPQHQKAIKYDIGCVHGRFQPPHFGHLEYILEAKKRCEFLWIGITRYEPKVKLKCEAAKHREAPFNNFLTYRERIEIIKDILYDESIGIESYAFIPFPIDEPEKLSNYLNTTVHCFVTVYDEWNRYKINTLKNYNYGVTMLWERDTKIYKGSDIRKLIIQGNNHWKKLVPRATVRHLQRLHIQDRLKKLLMNDRSIQE